MGINIGVCKFNYKREYEIEKLMLLEKLPEGDEKRKAEKDLNEILIKIEQESNELANKKIPELSYMGLRMYSLCWEIETYTIKVEFSFHKLYNYQRVFPETLKDIIHDINLLLPVAKPEMKRDMVEQLIFYQYLVDNNLMIYPN